MTARLTNESLSAKVMRVLATQSVIVEMRRLIDEDAYAVFAHVPSINGSAPRYASLELTGAELAGMGKDRVRRVADRVEIALIKDEKPEYLSVDDVFKEAKARAAITELSALGQEMEKPAKKAKRSK